MDETLVYNLKFHESYCAVLFCDAVWLYCTRWLEFLELWLKTC